MLQCSQGFQSAFHPPAAALAGEGAVGTHGWGSGTLPALEMLWELRDGALMEFLLPLPSLLILCLCKCFSSSKPAQVNSAGEAEIKIK